MTRFAVAGAGGLRGRLRPPQRCGGFGQRFEQRLQFGEPALLRVSDRSGEPGFDSHDQNVNVPRRLIGMVRNLWRHRLIERVPGELHAELDAERSDAQAAAAFGEVPAAVAELFTADLADAADDEGMAAEAPARRAIGDRSRRRRGRVRARRSAHSVENGAGPVNSSSNPRQGLVAATQHQRRPGVHAERKQADARRPAAGG